MRLGVLPGYGGGIASIEGSNPSLSAIEQADIANWIAIGRDRAIVLRRDHENSPPRRMNASGTAH